MPVQKFKTFEDARDALWLPPGDARILPRMRRLAELARPPRITRGITRFRSVAEAKAGRFAVDA